jgi:glutamate/tyrosine decarboxylase-like PLP-dependent enzyme
LDLGRDAVGRQRFESWLTSSHGSRYGRDVTADPLARAVDHARSFLAGLPERPVGPTLDLAALRAGFGRLPEERTDPADAIDRLVAAADPGLVASAGPRYFGFVTGGSVPASVAADWLTSVWDQNAALGVMSPAAAVCEHVVGEWLIDLLGLPVGAGVGLVTGGQMANTTCLAVARTTVLRRAGFDPDRDGLAGCPPVTVITGDETHTTIKRALKFLGIGSAQMRSVVSDDQGRIAAGSVAAELAKLAPGTPAIVCAQAGNVNSGSFDPFDDIADACAAHGAWLHIDGAFGMWAGATPSRRHLLTGHHRGDSWAVDLHKWLNVPYDSGVAIVRDASLMNEALLLAAPYIVAGQELRDGSSYSPESSRRARGFAAWAALRSLGRAGVAQMIEGCCELAVQLAESLAQEADLEILNDVVINQVMIRVGDSDDRTRALINAVQSDGTFWAGPTTWHGKVAMRISVSNWSTTAVDIERTAERIKQLAVSP